MAALNGQDFVQERAWQIRLQQTGQIIPLVLLTGLKHYAARTVAILARGMAKAAKLCQPALGQIRLPLLVHQAARLRRLIWSRV